MAIGALSTIAYALLFLGLRPWLSGGAANGLALALTAAANTQANRRFTFGIRGRAGLACQHAIGAVVYLLALGLTEASLSLLHSVAPQAPWALEIAVLVAASVLATISRYVALRAWVFAPGRAGGALAQDGPHRRAGRCPHLRRPRAVRLG